MLCLELKELKKHFPNNVTVFIYVFVGVGNFVMEQKMKLFQNWSYNSFLEPYQIPKLNK